MHSCTFIHKLIEAATTFTQESDRLPSEVELRMRKSHSLAAHSWAADEVVPAPSKGSAPHSKLASATDSSEGPARLSGVRHRIA
eukprot:2439206-Pyramimonas_sp.AAC.1